MAATLQEDLRRDGACRSKMQAGVTGLLFRECEHKQEQMFRNDTETSDETTVEFRPNVLQMAS